MPAGELGLEVKITLVAVSDEEFNQKLEIAILSEEIQSILIDGVTEGCYESISEALKEFIHKLVDSSFTNGKVIEQ